KRWFGASCYSGSAATAGGLVFVGDNAGVFHAYSSRTGAELWHRKLAFPIAAPPIVYSAGGREYVAVYDGGQAAALGGHRRGPGGWRARALAAVARPAAGALERDGQAVALGVRRLGRAAAGRPDDERRVQVVAREPAERALPVARGQVERRRIGHASYVPAV